MGKRERERERETERERVAVTDTRPHTFISTLDRLNALMRKTTSDEFDE